MKKNIFAIGALCIAAISANAQDVVATIDFSTMSEYPYGEIENVTTQIVDGVLQVSGTGWYQFAIAQGVELQPESTYTLTVGMKGSTAGSGNIAIGNWGGDGWIDSGITINFGTEWAKCASTFTTATAQAGFNIMFQPGQFADLMEFAWVVISKGTAEPSTTPDLPGGTTPPQPQETWESIITGGVAADGETPSIQDHFNGNAPVVQNPAGEGVAFAATIGADPENAWDSQLFVVFNEVLEAGAKLRVSLDYYCTDERKIDTQAQGNPGEYNYWNFIGSLNAKPEWQTYTWEGTLTADQAGDNGCKTIAFNLASEPAAGTFYVNNVVVEKAVASGISAVAVDANRTVVYNLMGVKLLDTEDATMLSTLNNGIYIINGKKVIIK